MIACYAHARAEQPIAFFGIAIGAPLELRECEPPNTTPRKGQGPCHDPIEGKRQSVVRFPESTLPAYVATDFVMLDTVNTRVEQIAFSTHGIYDQAKVVAALTEKLGKPTSYRTRPMQNAMGAKFEAVVATWKNASCEVNFVSASQKVDHGMVMIKAPDAPALPDPEEGRIKM